MKKLWWLLPVALLAAGSLVFLGCPNGGDDDDDGEYTYAGTPDFDLADWLADLSVGDTGDAVFPGGDSAERADRPFHPAGNPSSDVSVEVIETDGGDLALEFKTTATWGAGIDLNHAYFEFLKGDKIIVKGNLPEAATPGVYMTTDCARGEAGGGWIIATAGDFEKEYVLTAADITAIKTSTANNPQAIRIGAKPGNVTFIIYSIEVFHAVGAEAGYDAVTDITGVKTTIYLEDSPYTISASVEPSYATAIEKGKTIVWSLDDAGETGATITEAGVLTVTAAGTVKIKATIADGTAAGTAYTKTFTITVSGEAKPTEANIIIESGTGADWGWSATDGPGGGFKGKLNATISGQINELGGGEIWFYWDSVKEATQEDVDGGKATTVGQIIPIGANYGVGTIGETGSSNRDISLGEEGGTEITGILKHPIPDAGFVLDNGELNINVYNNFKITKIEVWE